MESCKKDFTYLLSCFLNKKKPESREYDWAGIYHLSDINDVAAIIAFLIKSVDEEYKPDGELMQYYKKSMAQAISSYEEKSNAYSFVSSLLEENDIDFIALKGIVLRELYPVREFRTSGDIDFVVRKDDIDKVYELVKNSDASIRSYNAGVLVFNICDSLVEIHDNADVGRDYFSDVFSMEKNHRLGEYDHLLYVLCHLIKHLAYRGAGIRMLMDIDVLIRSIDGFDADRFVVMCAEAGVEKSARVLFSLSNYLFNTPVKSFYDFSDDEDLLNKLETVLIDGGSFGYEMSFVPLSYLKKNGGRIGAFGKVKIALSMAFPEREYLKKCYRYYEKHSALYPVAVVNRLVDSTFKKRKNSKAALNQIFTNPDSAIMQKELAEELEIY